jgi:hypothetical protein
VKEVAATAKLKAAIQDFLNIGAPNVVSESKLKQLDIVPTFNPLTSHSLYWSLSKLTFIA